jgi:uncharacterized membrane protein YphA (DoxX/SURF4 family)
VYAVTGVIGLFYRVDYLLAVTLVGFLIGLACSRRSAHLPPVRIARAYLGIVLALLGLHAAAITASVVQPHLDFWNVAVGVITNLRTLLFAALFGLALRRGDGRALLLDRATFSAICIATAFTFALSPIGKAFSMDWMINFFHHSGYSTAFLKCTMIIEVLGALALLIPSTVLPACIVLSIDMFGAIYTHIHNGDPIHDSTDAYRELLRLAAIAVLWTMHRWSARRDAPLRIPLLGVAAGAIGCLLLSIAGGVLMRHIAHP